MNTDPNIEEAGDRVRRVIWSVGIGAAVLVVLVLVILSFAMQGQETSPAPPSVNMADIKETAATIRAQLPDPTATPVNVADIKEDAVLAFFDEKGHFITPNERLARIAEQHEGGFGGFYFDEDDRSHAYVYMLDPSNVEAAKAAFNQAYGEDSRSVTKITPVQGEYSFNDLVRWSYVLDRVLISAGIPPSTGSVSESKNRIRFGMRTEASINLAREITREIDIPEGAVVFRVSNPQLLSCLPRDRDC